LCLLGLGCQEGQHPHRDPKTLIIDRLDLTNSGHEPTLQSPTLTKW
jgi:hypothetical protein